LTSRYAGSSPFRRTPRRRTPIKFLAEHDVSALVDEDGVVVRMISDLLRREEIGNREASFLVARSG